MMRQYRAISAERGNVQCPSFSFNARAQRRWGRRHLHSCIAARREGDGPRSILSLIVASDDGMDYALSSLSYGVFIQVKKRLPWRVVGLRELLRER